MHKAWKADPADTLKAGPGFRLADVDPAATPGFTSDKSRGGEVLADGAARLSELQERLFARGVAGDERRMLLILQGMDTAGKDGIVRHVVGATDPEGIQLASFKAPTPWEHRHDFLWRIEKRVPSPGMLGVFNRSQYEDVLIQRVHALAKPEEIERRYGAINDFEASLVERGVSVVKVMLHISPREQKLRLAERLDRPDKHWKYNPSDLTERQYWGDYMDAYQLALERCSTELVPWHVVPADRKWYARIAVQQLLVSALEGLGLTWPLADFDIAAEKKRLAKL